MPRPVSAKKCWCGRRIVIAGRRLCATHHAQDSHRAVIRGYHSGAGGGSSRDLPGHDGRIELYAYRARRMRPLFGPADERERREAAEEFRRREGA